MGSGAVVLKNIVIAYTPVRAETQRRYLLRRNPFRSFLKAKAKRISEVKRGTKVSHETKASGGMTRARQCPSWKAR